MILLVEDEPLIAVMLEEELADAGYTVCSPASTVKRGLEVAECITDDKRLPPPEIPTGLKLFKKPK